MKRLLSPNEAKYWLMDVASPMNSVVVLRCPGKVDAGLLAAEGDFRLPLIEQDANGRPRWTAPAGQGVIREIRTEDAFAWLGVAEQLTDVRVGTAGYPPWHAVLIHSERDTTLDSTPDSTLVMALHHSLTDYRSGLWLAHCFLRGIAPGPLLPACEELLPASSYAHPDAEEIVSQWWLARAGARWHAIGVPELLKFLPPACKSRLRSVRFGAAETAAFEERCQREGVTLNGALAVALRDVCGMRRIAHSIDLSRFIKPALEDGPGIAISHLFTDVSGEEFWDAARDVRSRLFERLMSGAAGDELLVLPLALLRSELDVTRSVSEVTITGGPTLGRKDNAYAGYTMQLVIGSPRAGGKVVILSHHEGCLQLISSCPADQPELPLELLAQRLRQAVESS